MNFTVYRRGVPMIFTAPNIGEARQHVEQMFNPSKGCKPEWRQDGTKHSLRYRNKKGKFVTGMSATLHSRGVSGLPYDA